MVECSFRLWLALTEARFNPFPGVDPAKVDLAALQPYLTQLRLNPPSAGRDQHTVYLDASALNRPYDDQTNRFIAAETAVVRNLLGRVRDGELRLLYSDYLQAELSRKFSKGQQEEIRGLRSLGEHLYETPLDYNRASQLREEWRFGPGDALHVAAAERGGAHWLVTADRRFYNKAKAASRAGDPLRRVYVTVEMPLSAAGIS